MVNWAHLKILPRFAKPWCIMMPWHQRQQRFHWTALSWTILHCIYDHLWPCSRGNLHQISSNMKTMSITWWRTFQIHEESWRIQINSKWTLDEIQITPGRTSMRFRYPAFFCGRQISKASLRREISSKPSTPVVQKRQVLMAACKVKLSWRTSISSISSHGHFVLGFLWRIGSNLSTSPKRTRLLPMSLRLQAWRIFFLMAGNMMPIPSKNWSVVVHRPPCSTRSPSPALNRGPSFSCWAHSVSAATSRQSWN